MSWRSWTDYGYGIPLQNDRNFETIKECAPELIEKLLKDKVIYQKSYRYKADK